MTDPEPAGPVLATRTPAAGTPGTAANTADPQRNAFRRRAIGGVSSGYSRLVNVMKVALPLLALGIMGLVVAWPTFVEQRSRKLAMSAASSDLINPRYFSVDEQGQPFSVVARLARESSTEAGIVNLTDPEAEMRENEGTWVTLKSRTGDYNRDTRILHMVGSVHIVRDDGTEYTTDDAYADIAKGFAWGDGRIVGQGPQGEVDAEGFRLTDRGRTITFVNQTKANLPTASGGKAAPASPPPPTTSTAIPVPAVPSAAKPTPATATASAPLTPPLAVSPLAVSPTAPPSAPPSAPRRPPPAPETAVNRAPAVTLTPVPPATAPTTASSPAPTAKPVWQPPLPRRKPAPPKSRN